MPDEEIEDKASHRERSMAEYGHGNHWDCFTDEEALLTRHLRRLVEDGTLEDTAVLYGDFFEGQGPLETTVYSLVLPDHPLSGMALVAINEVDETIEFVSGYPYIKRGTRLRLRIDEIHEWPNHYEAVISGIDRQRRGDIILRY